MLEKYQIPITGSEFRNYFKGRQKAVHKEFDQIILPHLETDIQIFIKSKNEKKQHRAQFQNNYDKTQKDYFQENGFDELQPKENSLKQTNKLLTDDLHLDDQNISKIDEPDVVMLQDENEKLKSQYEQIKNQYTMLEDHLQRISHQRNHLLQKIDEKECKIIDLMKQLNYVRIIQSIFWKNQKYHLKNDSINTIKKLMKLLNIIQLII